MRLIQLLSATGSKFYTSVRTSTGAYFAAHVTYTRVYPVYIKAWKQSTADKLQKQAEESSTAATTATVLIKQLQETAKKAAEEAALLEDSQEGQEDDDISNLSDKESSDEEPELISDIWGPTQWSVEF